MLTLPNGIPSVGGEISQIPQTSPPQSGLNGNLIPPRYLPQFPFGHPELIHQHPFLPYNLANLRSMPSGLQHNTPSVPSSENMSLTRLSPSSSRPSSSSPPSTQNTSIRVHSNSEEESEDEQIDVVRSAFVPILRPNSVQSNLPDSTTVPDRSPPESRVPIKHELKAPSSRKPVWRPY